MYLVHFVMLECSFLVCW